MIIDTVFGKLKFLGRSNWEGKGSLFYGETIWSVYNDFDYMTLADELALTWKVNDVKENYYSFTQGEYGEERMRVYFEKDDLSIISEDYTTIFHPRLVILHGGNMLEKFVTEQIQEGIEIDPDQVYRVRISSLYRDWNDEKCNSTVLICKILAATATALPFRLSEGKILRFTNVMLQESIIETRKILLVYNNCIETENGVYHVEPIEGWKVTSTTSAFA